MNEPLESGQAKLATGIARSLEEDILRRGWRVGDRLGREDELATRWGVSRSVLREALAITERDGLTRRERGRLGGLVVASPSEDPVSMGLGNYLHLIHVQPLHLAQAWQALDGVVTSWAAARCTVDAAHAFRTLAAQAKPNTPMLAWAHAMRLHAELLGMAHNRAARILGLTLSHLCLAHHFLHLSQQFNVSPEAADAQSLDLAWHIIDLRCQLGECVLADRLMPAFALQQQLADLYLEAFAQPVRLDCVLSVEQADYISRHLDAAYGLMRPIKRADSLALQLLSLISLRRHVGDGSYLDTEAALMTTFGVGRGVLREAIRYLERYSIVRMEKGQKGGLRIATPDPSQAVRSAVLLFSFLGVGADEIDEVTRELELAAVSALAQRCLHDEAARLPALSQLLKAAPAAATEISAHLEQVYSGWMAAAGNPVIKLWMDVFGAFLRPERRMPNLSESELLSQYRVYLDRLQCVVIALQNADEALARRHMLQAREEIRFLKPEVRSLHSMLERIY